MPICVIRRVARVQIRQAREAGATVLDVTSKGPEPWVRFSPLYPHNGIPVPLSPRFVTASVEGEWQGLKVFERADIDVTAMANTTLKNLKRTTKRYGPMRGHRAGIGGKGLLGYITARYEIYLPLYRWVLQNRLIAELAEMQRLSEQGEVVLLDNGDVDDPSSPLSHAQLIRCYLETDWPARADQPVETAQVGA